jgi:hypothetical protein
MKERKNRTREECVAIVAAIQEKIKNGMNAKGGLDWDKAEKLALNKKLSKYNTEKK